MAVARNAGQRDQLITIEARAAGQDALGQANGSWATYATLWASARPMTGREQFASGQMQAQAPVTFRTDYRTDILPTMRVVWNGQPHEIVSPPLDVDGAHVDLELVCVAGQRDGRDDA